MARRAATPSPKVDRPPTPAPTAWVEVDLGDSELIVREHADGMFTLDMDGARVIASAEEMRPIAASFATLAAAKGWFAPTEHTSGMSTMPVGARGDGAAPRGDRPRARRARRSTV